MADAQHRQLVNVSFKKLYDCILDFENYPKYVTGVKKAKIKDRNSDSITVVMETELMKRIEYTISVKNEINDSGAKVWWNLVEGDFFRKNDGLWELVKVDDGNTQVLYKLDLEFAVSVPSFILKGLIKTNLPKAVEDMSQEAKRRKG